MSSIQIHEFSTGIIPEQTADGGWISRGFTGQYMNVTLDSIPYEVERSIANKEFAVSEGAFSDRPTMIGREVLSDSGVWSVVAVVTKGKDEKGRSASLYRYFLTDATEGLERILAWIKSEERAGRSVVFDPFDCKGINDSTLSDVEDRSPALSTPSSLSSSTPLVIEPKQNYTPELMTQTARSKSNENGEAVAWAFNVEALEQPRRFQVIYSASDAAVRRIQQAISSTPIALTSEIDEQAIKSAIKSLINASQVKSDAVQALEASLRSVEATLKPGEQERFWQDIFDGQGAVNAQKQQIHSPQMIRLLTLRAMILPKTTSDYLKWLQPDSGKKSSEACDTALAFQSQLARSIQTSSQLGDNLRKGVNNVLEQVFNGSVAVESANWLLNTLNGGLWSVMMPQMLEALRQFLASVRSDHPVEAVFQYNSRIWQQIQLRLKMPVSVSSKGDPKYLAIAELFTKLREPAIAACFYQAARGLVPPEIYADASRTREFRSGTAFGIPLRREKSAIDHFLTVIAHPLTIGAMLALIVVIVGATIFKSIEASRKEAEKEQQAQRSQQKPDAEPPIKDIIPGTSLPSKLPSSEQFQETRTVLQNLVQGLSADSELIASSADKTQIKQRVIEALESSLLGKDVLKSEKTALNYQGIIEKVPPPDSQTDVQKRRWIALIHSYQLKKTQLTPAGYIKTDQSTYNQLKQDVRNRLIETLPQNSELGLPFKQTPSVQPSPSPSSPAILTNPPQHRVNNEQGKP